MLCLLVQVLWYHNEKLLKESKDFQLTREGSKYSLLINEVYLEDSGEYRCTARNKLGSADTRCRLAVEGNGLATTCNSFSFIVVIAAYDK